MAGQSQSQATAASLESALGHLITTFNDLNTSTIHELDAEPSPLEFLRFVARSTPFVVRGAASSWKAVQKWTRPYLTSTLIGQNVNVAVTPYGNADAPTFSSPHNKTLLALPHEESQPFDEFLSYIIRQETDPSFPCNSEVRYAQTQNDNLRNEYISLFSDVQSDIPFARIALDRPPEAINLWLGNSKSVSAIHKDGYENIYVQIIGQKHFLLLPPVCQPCMNEKLLHPAIYARQGQGLSLLLDEGSEMVPFPTWDPDNANDNTTNLSHLARPLRVTLNPGDMLYLPAMWYHKVSQSSPPGDQGFVAAINYWHDMELSGLLFPLASLLREVGQYDGVSTNHIAQKKV